MRTLIISVFLVMLVSSAFAQDPEFLALLNVSVSDMELRPSAYDKIFFISQKTDKIYSGISDTEGTFKIKLPVGSVYQIKIKSFDQDMNYLAIEIPKSDHDTEFDIAIKYELPKTYTLKNVLFNTNSAVLLPSSYESLNDLAEFLLLKKSLKIELAGHTDNVGEDASNLILSQKRADSVRNYLIKKGVPETRIIAVGYGETQPVATNETEEGKQLNRRTEVRVLEE
jgi:outer membrane protein OmpA-like peptidoglycan-associated protein